jgi:CRP/FNR family transcriptional regulator
MTGTLIPISSACLPENCRTCTLRGAGLCHAVARQPSGARAIRLRRFDRDATIYSEGENPRFLGVLRRGVLRKDRICRNGDRTLLALAFPGDVVGGLPGERASFSLEAATDVEVCVFDIDVVRRQMESDPRFRIQILQEFSRRFERQLEMIWQRGVLTCRERIVGFLLLAATRMPAAPQPDGSVIVEIDISRRDWADLTNTSVESVSRTLNDLYRSGDVEALPYCRYRIRDLEGLTALAGLDPEHDFVGLRTDGKSATSRSLTAIIAPRRQGAILDALKTDATGPFRPAVARRSRIDEQAEIEG